jgi:hypothetical protein
MLQHDLNLTHEHKLPPQTTLKLKTPTALSFTVSH